MPFPLTVDASWFGPTGIGRFATEILERSPGGLAVLEIRRGAANASVLSPLWLAAEFDRRSGSRAFWSPGFMPPVLPASIWQAITVHDLTHLHFYGQARRAYYNAVIRPLMQRMDVVFTVSEFSRREILAWAGLAAERVVAVHHGLDASFMPEGDRLELGRPYVLYVGNRRPYKNLLRLTEAFARSGLAAQGFLLAFSGEREPALADLAGALGIGSDLHFLGAIPERMLPATYRGARAVAFVSLYEGFGFPIIEGMGCGVPVLTTGSSAQPEVAGGAALLVADPKSVDDIAEGLLRICSDETLRKRLVAAGLARARQFDWPSSAASYWKLIAAHC